MASILFIPLMFVCASAALYCLSANLPELGDEAGDIDRSALRFPSSLDQLSALAKLLVAYKSQHLSYVLLLFASAYLFKQTFSIPGSVFLNVLAGALFGPWLGFPLTCVLSAGGASICYSLSLVCGKQVILKYLGGRVQPIQNMIEENADSLFFVLLFLRLFPMSPNWLMNLVAPILNIPLHLFFLSVFLGLMPYNFVCVQAGSLLSEITSMDDILTMTTMLKLVGMAIIALVPTILIKKIQNKRKIAKSRLL